MTWFYIAVAFFLGVFCGMLTLALAVMAGRPSPKPKGPL